MGKISTAEVLRLRASSAVSRDRSAKRFAQDDGFVGVLKKNILNELALMGLRPGLSSARAVQINGIGDSVALLLLDKLVPRPVMAK
jgi:hypothetical protein